MKYQDCPLCHSNNAYRQRKLKDERYGFPGKFDVIQCLNCGHIYLAHKFSTADISNIYTSHYPRASFDIRKVEMINRVSPKWKSWINGEDSRGYYYVKNNKSVIDIGCGLGPTLFYYRAIKSTKILGIDPDKRLAQVGSKFGFDTQIGLFGNVEAKKLSKQFEVAVIDQVIEYMTNPRELIRNIRKILKDKGELILATPNFNSLLINIFGNYSFTWHAPYHLQFFNIESLRRLLSEEGFRITYMHTKTSSEWIYYEITNWLLLKLTKKRSKSAIFYPYVKRTLPEFIIIALSTLWHKLHINHILSRIIDTFNMGENIVIVAEKIK
jgi:2-polyprenyl-3-methyl-5-hydroxy-6-metoxy-1,4-benzoquinol methylase